MRTRKQSAVERNQDFVDRIKEDDHCMDCEQYFPPCAMDFDHIDGVKRASVSQLVQRGCSLAAISEEIEKCEVVCACCHRIRTAERRAQEQRDLWRARRRRLLFV